MGFLAGVLKGNGQGRSQLKRKLRDLLPHEALAALEPEIKVFKIHKRT